MILLLAGDVSVNPGPAHSLRVGTINARSMRPKAPAISDLVTSKSLDILSITETWLTKRETTAGLTDITPIGFSLYHKPRAGRKKGGGIALLLSSSLRFSAMSIPDYKSFEAICGKVSYGMVSFNVLNVYRPPGSTGPFLEEFQDVLAHLASFPQHLIVLGDFNIHVDTQATPTSDFLDTLDSFGLSQHVHFPTHIHGHTIDLVITSIDFPPQSVKSSDPISDHFTVIAEFDISIVPPADRQKIKYRNIKSIDIDAFKQDVLSSKLITDPSQNASDLATQYNNTLSSLLDKHAPKITRQVVPKPKNPWMNADIAAAKLHRRRLERVWRRNPTQLNRSRFTRQAHLCNRMMSKAKSSYYTEIINSNSGDQRSAWKSFNDILHRHRPACLPDCKSLGQLASTFGSYFSDKISVIHAAFPNNSPPMQDSSPNIDILPLDSFVSVTQDEVRRLILASPCKSCELDPIPTILLKSCLDVLITPITSLINMSLAEGSVPPAFKSAVVTPLLKKTTLPRDDMKNYRPVSNLSFLSKLLEKVVAKRIQSHLHQSGSSNPFQSAYKKFHSTETALLKIHNDITLAMDKGNVTALTLLDLSAAFDTIDHSILLQRLETWFGIRDSALAWLSSYLKDRNQQVRLGEFTSPKCPLIFGVPQGSVLGPLLFTLYTTPLGAAIQGHCVSHHLYADDSQIYLSFSSRDSTTSLNVLSECLASVQGWMLANKLKLNPGKTEFLLIGNKAQRDKFVSLFPFDLMGNKVKPAKSGRNLGVIFDENFNFRKHILQVCASCYYHIRDLRRIRRHLNLNSAKTLATCLVASRLDYCNSLLFGVASNDILRLQRVQNCLARVVTRSPPLTRSLPLLSSLHWLPIQHRITFKINLITFKTVKSSQPTYLHELLTPASSVRHLRSDKGLKFSVPMVKSKAGSRAFSVCAPQLWNKLPLELRSASSVASFKRGLKTHLFKQAFPP